MEASTNVIYSVVINRPKYLGSIEVIDRNLGHVVKFEFKENDHKSEQVITREFSIVRCDKYRAECGPRILVLNGYDSRDNWLCTLTCELDGKLNYHKYQQSESFILDTIMVNRSIYEKALLILEMKDCDDPIDDSQTMDIVNCDKQFLDKVINAYGVYPSVHCGIVGINTALFIHHNRKRNKYRLNSSLPSESTYDVDILERYLKDYTDQSKRIAFLKSAIEMLEKYQAAKRD